MKKTVLILGAKGRFGRNAAETFARRGWQVRAFGRNWSEATEALDARIEKVEGDGFSAASIKAAAEGMDVVIQAMNAPYHKWSTDQKAMNDAVIEAMTGTGKTVFIPGNVYNFGTDMPPLLEGDTPHAAKTRKGQFRTAMERSFRDAKGFRTVVLRGGDFIDTVQTGNWFDGQMIKDIAKGTFMYPGNRRIKHAWAFLPDMARAMVELAEKADELSAFEDIGFAGYGLTGEELHAGLERVMGRTLKVSGMPWPLVQVLGLVQPMMREILEMRYLWETPHELDGSRLKALLPDFEPTKLDDALAQSLRAVMTEDDVVRTLQTA